MTSTCDISQKVWLSVNEACAYLNVCRATLSKLQRDCKIAFYKSSKTESKRAGVLFKRSDLDKYVEKEFVRMKTVEEMRKY
jgi:excisionase family DNA binding protein